MAEKRPSLPLMLTAQDLRGGGVVYWDGTGWAGDLAAGLIARDEADAAALDTVRAEAAAGTEVLDVFLFTVRDGAPVHYREASRVIGPSFRDDFGRNPPRNPGDAAHV